MPGQNPTRHAPAARQSTALHAVSNAGDRDMRVQSSACIGAQTSGACTTNVRGGGLTWCRASARPRCHRVSAHGRNKVNLRLRINVENWRTALYSSGFGSSTYRTTCIVRNTTCAYALQQTGGKDGSPRTKLTSRTCITLAVWYWKAAFQCRVPLALAFWRRACSTFGITKFRTGFLAIFGHIKPHSKHSSFALSACIAWQVVTV
jgi:hypothetical protein